MSYTLTLFVFFMWFIVGSIFFRRILKVERSCGTTLALFVIACAGTMWTQKAIDWYYDEWEIIQEEYAAEKRAKETQRAVMSFLKEMNPPLNKKLIEINQEIALMDNKIQQLVELKENFPNHAPVVDKTLNQWQMLKKQLSDVSQNIYQKIEQAYVTYRIDEIQGRDKFSVLSQELLKEANTALANAETTKLTIEKQLEK